MKASKMTWAGRILSGIIGLLFIMSSAGKFAHGPEVIAGMAKFGFPESYILPLGILEAACALIYLIPATSVLGAILLTGYIGGAIVTHWRMGEVFVVQTLLGILTWGGLYLRNEHLRKLIPFCCQRSQEK